MMATRLTTLHTPCDTGDTRARVLKANWLYRWYRRPTLRDVAEKEGGGRGRDEPPPCACVVPSAGERQGKQLACRAGGHRAARLGWCQKRWTSWGSQSSCRHERRPRVQRLCPY